jgi:hypothetical protein
MGGKRVIFYAVINITTLPAWEGVFPFHGRGFTLLEKSQGGDFSVPDNPGGVFFHSRGGFSPLAKLQVDNSPPLDSLPMFISKTNNDLSPPLLS